MYLGPPGRLNILASQKSFKIDDECFRYFLIDCRSVSSTGTTIFENTQTRDDLLDLFIQSKEAIQRIPKDDALKIAMISDK